MSRTIERVMRTFERDFFCDPRVYLFQEQNKQAFENIKLLLKEKGFKLIYVNQALIVDAKDYNMPISKAGYTGPTGKETINDVLVDDEHKRGLIVSAKLGEIEEQVDKKTVLVVDYNNQVLTNEGFYETVRQWLKDGVSSLRSIKAIVYLETNERVGDFCPYGFYCPNDWLMISVTN